MLENLTPREREIFDLLLEGVSPKEIAFNLNLKPSTVDYHRTKLYNKLGIHSIQELFVKYSTKGKEAPPEQETLPIAVPSAEFSTAIPVSENKKYKRLKFLLPVKIAIGIIILVFSVLLLWVFIGKSSAYPKPKGVIISAHDLSFYPMSDAETGGNSESEIFLTTEEIDGINIDVLNIKIKLAGRKDSDMIYAKALTRKPELIKRLRQANGIRFKTRGDGKTWAIEFHTAESIPERNYACYVYMAGTTRDKVVVVDIPYSSLFLPDWWGQQSFDFNKETITDLSITANSIHGYGQFLLQIFDFEIY